MRVRANISYNGQNFSGFQYQHDYRTVQGTIEKQLKRMHKTHTRLHGASRTDSGVHAIDQYIHFDTTIDLPRDKWQFILNRSMPDDIYIKKVDIVDDDFHSRFNAKGKTYRYKIYTGNKNPFYAGLKTHCMDTLNLEKIRDAAAPFVGVHDFTTFSSAKAEIKNKVREIKQLDIEETTDGIDIVITGTGFLYNMVRIIVAYLLEVGKGKREADTLNMLKAKDRTIIPKTAPAEGLYLEKVWYEDI
ncbi:tRNA pseudouridine(38-40) synthase TruA [Jeotgalicoccus sp. ATCC 8456]|uniref:tRNA pseudouridine(38-40) synthase TruA n=1 Tax=Jeotgalicoccus sp. ATCC 8456 TaxID=946435 RepID=UPI0018E5B81B|nr:tRNA pseudouridine(38-40) synthase TruA [Jeotgalicoccus sp. ATCC 8456]QQD84253.1 tRNA pseudouridine(38-40) synthase TruA [Jeotgalicoccus sp. ATCC 8456]